MKTKNIVRILLSLVLVFGFSSAWAKTIKWSMQGDSLTLDPHAQNEGPTTQVSRQVYEALVQRGLDMKIGPALATKWKATDPNTWIFENTSTLNINWRVEYDVNATPAGGALTPMASATAGNGYMFVSSDADGGSADNDGTTIECTFTNATPIDLSAYPDVVLFRYCPSQVLIVFEEFLLLNLAMQDYWGSIIIN